MDQFFKALFGGGVAALVLFSAPKITLHNDQITVAGKLNNSTPEKVERIINTGTEVEITFYISLTIYKKSQTLLFKKRVKNSIRFDPLKKVYHVNSDGKKAVLTSKERAVDQFESYKAVFNQSEKKSIDNGKVDFYVEASIDYKSSINMNLPAAALWNYHTPNRKIENVNIEVIK